MNIPLRKGNRNPIGVKGFFDRFGEAVMHWPVVAAFDPGSADKVDAAVGEGDDCNQRFGLVEHALICSEQAFDNGACGIDIVLIANTKYEINTASVVGGVVDNIATDNAAIGDDYFFIVAGMQFGGEDLDALNDARCAGGFDKVADFKRAKNQQ